MLFRSLMRLDFARSFRVRWLLLALLALSALSGAFYTAEAQGTPTPTVTPAVCPPVLPTVPIVIYPFLTPTLGPSPTPTLTPTPGPSPTPTLTPTPGSAGSPCFTYCPGGFNCFQDDFYSFDFTASPSSYDAIFVVRADLGKPVYFNFSIVPHLVSATGVWGPAGNVDLWAYIYFWPSGSTDTRQQHYVVADCTRWDGIRCIWEGDIAFDSISFEGWVNQDEYFRFHIEASANSGWYADIHGYVNCSGPASSPGDGCSLSNYDDSNDWISPIEVIPGECYDVIPSLTIQIPDFPGKPEWLISQVGIPGFRVCFDYLRFSVSLFGVDASYFVALGAFLLSLGFVYKSIWS